MTVVDEPYEEWVEVFRTGSTSSRVRQYGNELRYFSWCCDEAYVFHEEEDKLECPGCKKNYAAGGADPYLQLDEMTTTKDVEEWFKKTTAFEVKIVLNRA